MLRSAHCYFTQKEVCMKEENATSIEYFRDFRRVADLINGVIFHGKQIVRECDLQEQNPVLHDVTKKNDKVSAIENTPDLSVMAGIWNLQLIKQKIQTEGGRFDMCKAIKEMLRDSRQEGRKKGRQEGRQEGRKEGRQEGRQEGQDEMAILIEKLMLSNRISELLKVTTDKEYRNKLLIEYGIA